MPDLSNVRDGILRQVVLGASKASMYFQEHCYRLADAEDLLMLANCCNSTRISSLTVASDRVVSSYAHGPLTRSRTYILVKKATIRKDNVTTETTTITPLLSVSVMTRGAAEGESAMLGRRT